METQSIWEMLSGLTVGSVISWIIVIFAIITVVGGGAIKLYKVFVKLNNFTEENKEQKIAISQHEKAFVRIENSLNEIHNSLKEQAKVNLGQLRYSIITICENAISAGEISSAKLKNMEEMYEEYINIYHGNGYVKTLVNKVRDLPVIGTLEE